MERVVPEDKISEIASLSSHVFQLPVNFRSLKTDALVTYPGQGEKWRISKVIRIWDENSTARFLLVGGQNQDEIFKYGKIATLELRERYGLQKITGVKSQITADHTGQQAEWVLNQIVQFRIQSLTLFAPSYHLLRAYLVLLKNLLKSGQDFIPLIPYPIPVSPFEISPDNGVDDWAMVPGEIQRIIEYTKLGYIASIDELKIYLKWLYSNVPLAP